MHMNYNSCHCSAICMASYIYIYAAIYIYEYLKPLYIYIYIYMCVSERLNSFVTIVVIAKLMLPMHVIPAAISCMLIVIDNCHHKIIFLVQSKVLSNSPAVSPFLLVRVLINWYTRKLPNFRHTNDSRNWWSSTVLTASILTGFCTATSTY